VRRAAGRVFVAAATVVLVAAAAAVLAPNAVAATRSSQSSACQNDFGTKTPVLLVHGFHEGTDVWSALVQAIQQDVPGAQAVTPFDYPDTQWVTDPDVAPKLADVIGCLARDSAGNGGAGKVIIVAHSMGGLAVRCAVSTTCAGPGAANPAQIGLEITLGTPNSGSLLATAGNGLSFAGQLSCETVLAMQTGLVLPCPDLLGWLFGANTPAARALESGVDGTPSQDIANLPPLPSTVPLDAIAGQVTVTTSLFQLGTFQITGSQLGDLGDLVVSEASALDGAPPTTPAHPGTSAPHPGPGSGAPTIPCGTVSIGTLLGVGPGPGGVTPSITCWHNTETTDSVWVAHVVAAIKAAAVAFGGISPSALTGTWEGTYVCAQGETGLRLVIHAAAGGTLTATFNFFPVASNPGVPSGSYTMTGTYSATGVQLTQNQWINQPDGYEMVDISADPPSQGGVLHGSITTCGTTFTLTRKATG
jgi:pimeloyl-ACP methyl ester carboxylesterase